VLEFLEYFFVTNHLMPLMNGHGASLLFGGSIKTVVPPHFLDAR